MRLVKANEATATRRRVFFHLVNGTDGITAVTTETGGQPQVSSDGGAWTNTGISTLTAVGNGRYYADLTQALVATAGTSIETRYKSANTAECPGDSVMVVAFDPFDAAALGLSRIDTTISSRMATFTLPTNFSSLAISGTGAVTVGTNNDKTGYALSSSQTFNMIGNITGNLSGSVGSVSGDVGGKVLGGGASAITGDGVRAASVTGAVGSVTAAVTVGTNNDKTGYSLSGSQTFSTSGSVGSVTGSVGSVTGAVGSVTGAVGSVTGDVGGKVLGGGAGVITGDGVRASSVTGNVGGSVASVTGNVGGSVASVVGNVGGNVTGSVGSVVGNVGGNVTGSVGSVLGTVTANTTLLAGQTVTAATGVTFPTTVSSLTAANVWQTDISGYTTAGYAGTYLKGAGAAGDPWSASLPGAYGVGTAGYIVGTNLNATITSRMATFTLPTNFSSLAIDGGGAVTAGTVNDKTGYSLTQAFPTNFSALAVTAGGAVTAGTVSDKTGYSLSTSQTFSTSGSVGSVTGTVGSVSGSVASVTGDVGGKVLGGGAGVISGDGVRAASVTGAVGSVTAAVTVGTINANAINAAAIATDAIDADAIAASAVTELQSGLSTLSALQVENAVWDAHLVDHTASNSFGGRLPRTTTGSVNEIQITNDNHVSASVHDMQAGTITSNAISAGAIDANALATSAATEIADNVWNANISTTSAGAAWTASTFGQRVVRSDSTQALVEINVDHRVSANVEEMQPNVITASALAADAGAEIADAVWDEAIVGHTTVGTTGKALYDGSLGGGGGNLAYIPVTLPLGTGVRHTLTYGLNSTLPYREDIIQDAERNPIDLTGVTQVLYTLVPVNGASGGVSATGALVDAAAGRVRYEWQVGDLSDPGEYRERWELDSGSGTLIVSGPLVRVI